HPLELLRRRGAEVPDVAVVTVGDVGELVLVVFLFGIIAGRLLLRFRPLGLHIFLRRRRRRRAALELRRLHRLGLHGAFVFSDDLAVAAEEREVDLRAGLLIVQREVDDRADRHGRGAATPATAATAHALRAAS